MSRLALGMEHRVLRELRASVAGGRWLVAVSGGLDSMVLLEILHRWRRHLRCEIAVGHVHHGTDTNAANRLEAQTFVREHCRARRIPFLTLHPRPRGLRSEAELRDFRHRTLARWRRKYGFDLVAFAHHRDDLLETRLLRLLRGSGPQGLVAMRLHSGVLLRPLLTLSRAEIADYARARGLAHVEDPSNASVDPFRNWLRHEWLPQLEKRQPGAGRALARSLASLAPSAEEGASLPAFVGVRRASLATVSSPQQRTIVAGYLRALGVRGYGRSHVEEILKRMRTRRREFTFEMLGWKFSVTPELLMASRV